MKRKVLMICKKDTLTTPPSESKKNMTQQVIIRSVERYIHILNVFKLTKLRNRELIKSIIKKNAVRYCWSY